MKVTFDSNDVATVECSTYTNVFVWADSWCDADDFAKLDAAGIVTSDWDIITIPFVKREEIQAYMFSAFVGREQLRITPIDVYVTEGCHWHYTFEVDQDVIDSGMVSIERVTVPWGTDITEYLFANGYIK